LEEEEQEEEEEEGGGIYVMPTPLARYALTMSDVTNEDGRRRSKLTTRDIV